MKPLSACRLYTFVDTAYLHGRAPELVARDIDDYVRIVVELTGDEARRADLRRRLRAGADSLFENRDGVRALERFLIESISQGQGSVSAPPLS